MDTKQKYVRLGTYNEVIIFPCVIQHSEFRDMKPISAGFCYVGKDKITCFGESFSLGLDSKPDDSYMATKQVMGWAVAERLIENKNDTE